MPLCTFNLQSIVLQLWKENLLTEYLNFIFKQKELCNMILDCCAQQRTYEKFFGLLAGVSKLFSHFIS